MSSLQRAQMEEKHRSIHSSAFTQRRPFAEQQVLLAAAKYQVLQNLRFSVKSTFLSRFFFFFAPSSQETRGFQHHGSAPQISVTQSTPDMNRRLHLLPGNQLPISIERGDVGSIEVKNPPDIFEQDF